MHKFYYGRLFSVRFISLFFLSCGVVALVANQTLPTPVWNMFEDPNNQIYCYWI